MYLWELLSFLHCPDHETCRSTTGISPCPRTAPVESPQSSALSGKRHQTHQERALGWGGGGVCGGVWWWWWWCGPLCYTKESVLPRALLHLIQVAEHLGASSRRPRHPFPALMAGSALKSHQPNFTELQMWNLDRLLHVCTREQARAALWDSTVFSTPAPEEIASQPSRRTPCQ